MPPPRRLHRRRRAPPLPPGERRREGLITVPPTREARLPYWPALDGLRGAALVAILFFHARIGWAKGGFLCVSVFFTLSGFLITSLVLAEHRGTGQVRIPAFWVRRARRLIPASIIALVLAAIVTAVAVPEVQRASVAGDIRAALFQFANWRFIQQGAVYADLNVVPSPVQHYWSLAIEEQFYVVFPVLAALVLSLRRRLGWMAIGFFAVAAASLARQIVVEGVDRVYFGTDTRAAELAIGGLLAIAYPRLRDLRGVREWRLADIGGFVGLAASAILFLGVPHQRSGIYDGGLAAFSIVSSMMVFGAVEGDLFRRLLSFRPLVGLGKISYGVYLYHFPFYVLLSEERVGFGGLWLLALRVIPTITMAWLSYRFIERPIRVGAALPGRLGPIALAGGLAAVLLVAVPVGRSGDEQRLVFRELDPTTSTSATSTTAAAPDVTATAPVGTTPEVTAPAVRRPTTTTLPPARAPRIVVVGDSTAAANGRGLEEWGVETGRLQAVTVSRPGCGVLHGVQFTIREGYQFQPNRCETLFRDAMETARELGADAIVVFVGSSQLADWEYEDLEGVHHIGEPVIDTRLGPALETAVSTLAEAGLPVLWATVPTPEWDLEVFSQIIGSPVPGEGPITLNDPPRTVRLNELNSARVPRIGMATLWPYASRLAGPDGRIPTRIRPDGLHLSDDGVREIAEAWLFDTLGTAYREVVARQPAGLAPVERHAWT